MISHEHRLQKLLGLKWSPVALTFRSSAPSGIPRVAKAAPSGCTYWKLASEGQTFYTEASDHFKCPRSSIRHGRQPFNPIKQDVWRIHSLLSGVTSSG
jgi:hypothetical protein